MQAQCGIELGHQRHNPRQAVLVRQVAGQPIRPERATNIQKHRCQHGLISRITSVHIPSGMPSTPPDGTELARAFNLGVPLGPAEWMTSGWGGHNHLWCLATSHGKWAIKQVGREPSQDPDGTLVLELAAYSGGIPMPRPIPTTSGRCFALLDGCRYRCHEWLDGSSLRWHGHTRATAGAVGGMLARVHGLRLPRSSHLAAEHASPGFNRWITLLDSARSCDAELRIPLERALPSIQDLETLTLTIAPVESIVGSHRDLHPSNVMRLSDGHGLVLVDWDAAGPVVPAQEVVCFALVYAERDNNAGYAAKVAWAFINGYRAASGAFAFTGCEDLAMLVQGRLWWTEQNLRMALVPRATADQRHLSVELLRNLERLPAEFSQMCDILFACAHS